MLGWVSEGWSGFVKRADPDTSDIGVRSTVGIGERQIEGRSLVGLPGGECRSLVAIRGSTGTMRPSIKTPVKSDSVIVTGGSCSWCGHSVQRKRSTTIPGAKATRLNLEPGLSILGLKSPGGSLRVGNCCLSIFKAATVVVEALSKRMQPTRGRYKGWSSRTLSDEPMMH
jgi:hypothetical protein